MINELNKEAIRRRMLLKRKKLSAEYILKNSKIIADNLMKLDIYQQSTNIMLYVATKSEVQTWEIIKSAQKDKKNIFIPLIIRGSNMVFPSLVKDFEKELIRGDLGIFQPSKEFYRLCPPNILDLVIVPGVAFTVQGYRLGRGGGYYDHFLSQLEPRTISVALAFEMQILTEIPVEEKDIPVDYIITEKRIIKIRE
ncbi:MAG: 5-formyltetrahydrofolate cyclo-ligase [Candidatus Caldatribacteriota bacterium]